MAAYNNPVLDSCPQKLYFALHTDIQGGSNEIIGEREKGPHDTIDVAVWSAL